MLLDETQDILFLYCLICLILLFRPWPVPVFCSQENSLERFFGSRPACGAVNSCESDRFKVA